MAKTEAQATEVSGSILHTLITHASEMIQGHCVTTDRRSLEPGSWSVPVAAANLPRQVSLTDRHNWSRRDCSGGRTLSFSLANVVIGSRSALVCGGASMQGDRAGNWTVKCAAFPSRAGVPSESSGPGLSRACITNQFYEYITI